MLKAGMTFCWPISSVLSGARGDVSWSRAACPGSGAGDGVMGAT